MSLLLLLYDILCVCVSFLRRAGAAADAQLLLAFRLNRLVPPYLLGDKSIDGAVPAATGHAGEVEEAVAIASGLFDVWQLVPGAVGWCSEMWKESAAAVEAEYHTAKAAAAGTAATPV